MISIVILGLVYGISMIRELKRTKIVFFNSLWEDLLKVWLIANLSMIFIFREDLNTLKFVSDSEHSLYYPFIHQPPNLVSAIT